jgi:hypothetical protein
MTPSQILALVARARFEPFTETDWDAFAGCSSENPLIAEVDHYILIIDGAEIQVTDSEKWECWNVQLSVDEI